MRCKASCVEKVGNRGAWPFLGVILPMPGIWTNSLYRGYVFSYGPFRVRCEVGIRTPGPVRRGTRRLEGTSRRIRQCDRVRCDAKRGVRGKSVIGTYGHFLVSSYRCLAVVWTNFRAPNVSGKKSENGGLGRFSVSSYRCLGFVQIAYMGDMCHSACPPCAPLKRDRDAARTDEGLRGRF